MISVILTIKSLIDYRNPKHFRFEHFKTSIEAQNFINYRYTGNTDTETCIDALKKAGAICLKVENVEKIQDINVNTNSTSANIYICEYNSIEYPSIDATFHSIIHSNEHNKLIDVKIFLKKRARQRSMQQLLY